MIYRGLLYQFYFTISPVLFLFLCYAPCERFRTCSEMYSLYVKICSWSKSSNMNSLNSGKVKPCKIVCFLGSDVLSVSATRKSVKETRYFKIPRTNFLTESRAQFFGLLLNENLWNQTNKEKRIKSQSNKLQVQKLSDMCI